MSLKVQSWCFEARAQVIPGAIDPGRLQQQFQPPIGPAPTPELISPFIPEAVPPAEAEQITLTLRQIVIDGSTVFSEPQLNQIYRDFLGHDVTLADIYRIADAITTQYRADGYILSRAVVPAQRISNGEVHITVVEGFINKVIIQGKVTAIFQSYADHLAQARPLTSADLERNLLLINDLPGVQAHAVLAASDNVPGGSDLTLMVDDKGMDFIASLDNRGSKYIGPLTLFTEAAVNDPSGLSDRISLRYATSPATEAELRYFALGYELPLGSQGLKFALTVGGNLSTPGSSLQSTSLMTDANGETVTGKLSYPLTRSRAENLFADLSFTLRNSSFSQLGLPGQERLASSYKDRIRALRSGISYDMLDEWDGRDFLRLELSQGLPILNAVPDGSLSNSSRAGGRTEFTKGSLDASRQQPLSDIVPGLSLLTAASAGWSFGQKLLASEQFGVGGAQFGRGYDPSELTGDYGVAAKAELQYLIPAIMGLEGHGLQSYVFYDCGLVSNQNPASSNQPERRQLASAGAGFRLAVASEVSLNLELAKPLTRAVAAFANMSDAKPLRLFFGLIGTF
jgi:hemolysin activation/secretion protein